MPIISKEMKKATKKLQQQENRQKEQEEHRLREEQAQKEKEEREAQEKEQQQKQLKQQERTQKRKERHHKEKAHKKELERRTNIRKELAFLKKTTATKEIKDEEVLARDNFSITRKEIESGSYCKIYRAKHGENQNIVCKVIVIDKCPQKYRENLLEQSLRIQRFIGSGAEGGVPKQINFVKVLDIFATNKKVYIFMGECQTLSIEQKIKSGDTITEDEAKRWAKQVFEAINYLHSIGISHMNIRPEHVIFDKDNIIKVVGLDMACIYWDSDMEQVIPKKKISSKDKKELERMNHMPPEAFSSETFDPSMADVWSLGILLCQMITKENPFKVKKSDESHEDEWRAFAQSHQFSDEAKQLLDRIFVVDITTRVKVDELLQDPFFKNAS